MGYDRHAGHAELLGKPIKGTASKSSYDGARKSPMSKNSQRPYNRIEAGDYGNGRAKLPHQVNQLFVDGDHKTNAKSGAGGGRDTSSPSNSAAVSQRTARQQKQPRSFKVHPQHPGWPQAIARGPNKRVVST